MSDNLMSKSETMGLLTIYFKSFFVWLSQIMGHIMESLPDPPPEEMMQIFGDGETFRAEFIAFASKTISDRMDLEDESIPLLTLREEYAFILERLIPILAHDAPRDVLLNMYARMPFMSIASIPDSVPPISLTSLLYFGEPTRRELIAWEAVVSDVARSFSIPATDVFVVQGARYEVTRRCISRQEYMDMFAGIIKTIFRNPMEMRSELIMIHLLRMEAQPGDGDAHKYAERIVDERMPRYVANMKAARNAVVEFLSEERKRIYGS